MLLLSLAVLQQLILRIEPFKLQVGIHVPLNELFKGESLSLTIIGQMLKHRVCVFYTSVMETITFEMITECLPSAPAISGCIKSEYVGAPWSLKNKLLDDAINLGIVSLEGCAIEGSKSDHPGLFHFKDGALFRPYCAADDIT